jgi:hypothetical protein
MTRTPGERWADAYARAAATEEDRLATPPHPTAERPLAWVLGEKRPPGWETSTRIYGVPFAEANESELRALLYDVGQMQAQYLADDAEIASFTAEIGRAARRGQRHYGAMEQAAARPDSVCRGPHVNCGCLLSTPTPGSPNPFHVPPMPAESALRFSGRLILGLLLLCAFVLLMVWGASVPPVNVTP